MSRLPTFFLSTGTETVHDGALKSAPTAENRYPAWRQSLPVARTLSLKTLLLDSNRKAGE